jgi:hypothetical protein
VGDGLDGAGEGQIFLRDLPAGIMGTKPKAHPIPIIMDFRVVIESLGLGPDLVNEGQGGFEII